MPSSVLGPRKRTSPVRSFIATIPFTSNQTRHGAVPSGAAPTKPSPLTANAFATCARYAESTVDRVTTKAVASHGCPGRSSASIVICARSRNGFGCRAGTCGICRGASVGSGVIVGLAVGEGARAAVATAVGDESGTGAPDVHAMTSPTSPSAAKDLIRASIRRQIVPVI